jgi:hypothetical protein
VSRQDLNLNRSAAKSGILLPTILEGTPLESSAVNMKLEPREFFGLDSIEHEEVVGASFDCVVPEAMCTLPPLEVPYSHQVEVLSDGLAPVAMVGWFRSDEAGVVPEAMCKLPPLEVPYSNQVEVLSNGLTPEAMVGLFCSDETEWYTFNPSAPEAMVKIDDDGIAEREKANIKEPASEAMCKINKAEFPGSRNVECLKNRPIAPEAMPKFNIEKDLRAPEAMCKYSKAKKRIAECSTISESAPEAMMKSDKGGCLESEKGNVWKTHSNAPEAMPKVGIARGLSMNTYKLHTSHPRAPEAMVKIDGGSYTIGELEPRLDIGMGGELPRNPQMVSEMDGSSKLQFNPAAPSHLDGNTKNKLGVIGINGQIAAAMNSDDAKVPEYLWDMRALRLE